MSRSKLPFTLFRNSFYEFNIRYLSKIGTTQAKLIELIFESFYKDFYKTFEKFF